MARPEYMRLKLADIPAAIIDLYKVRDIAQDGYVFVRIQKGMYGLPQAGIIAQQLLEQRLQANGYHQSKLNPSFWTHDWRPICFALCVDDFGVKYVGKVHAKHLINTLTGHYDISWDYRNRTVRLSMPGYCEKPDNVSITLCLPNHNTNLIPALHAPTAANNNYVPLLTLHQHWASNKGPSYKKSLEFSFIMLGQLTAPCLRPSALLQHNRPNLQQPP
eukprot:CCRYP_007187-RE/>CCRYP_007187-RE protein AED:0.41 eAED:0.41 QI:0/0/0/1/0/0/2/0/217